ncbi:MAG: 16S rRNA (adenine(1518)-N(6)/adenine(1519)-N(6))-dimethyltransferase RsmA [Thermoanaerobaculia bacterium]
MRAPRLDKRLGQHHLRRPDLCAPLVDFLAPSGRTVIEIGPGGGALTEALLAAGARVLGWEVDLAWALRLGSASRSRALAVVAGDALDLPFARLPAGTLVAGNLPYNVATALIDRLLADGTAVSRAAFLVQWEVARRLAAAPDEPDYGALSVLTQARSTVEILGRVPRRAFRPPPKVDGAFVALVPRAVVPAELRESFRAVVLAAFQARRKTLRNSLAMTLGRLAAERLLAVAAVVPDRRAEQLSLDQFVALARAKALEGEEPPATDSDATMISIDHEPARSDR